MTILFSSDFETGNLADWFSSSSTTGNSISVEAFPHSGAYSARFVNNPTTNLWAHSMVTASINTPLLYAKCVLNIDQGLPLPTGEKVWVIQATGGPSAIDVLAEVQIREEAGSSRWHLLARNGTGYVSNSNLTLTPPMGQWVLVELQWESSLTGTVRLYINGILAIEMTGIDTSAYGNALRVRYGIGKYAGTIAYTWTENIDECIIADAPVPTNFALSFACDKPVVATIGSQSVVSGQSIPLAAGTTVMASVPAGITVGGINYAFDYFGIDSQQVFSNPMSVQMIGNLILTAVYAEEVLPTTGFLEIHATFDEVEVTAQATVDGAGPYETPFSLEMNPGTYNIICAYNGKEQTKSAIVVSGQTYRIDFPFTSSQGFDLTIPLIVGVGAVAVLAGGKKKK